MTNIKTKYSFWLDLKYGFRCNNCKTNAWTVMYIDKDNQLKYKCTRCGRQWI